MVFASVREFRNKGTKFLNGREEVVITKYGKPIAVLSPVEDRSAGALLLGLRGVLKGAGISKKQILDILGEVRREVYRS